MTGRWWKIYAGAVHDPALVMMTSREFRRKLLARFRGEENEFSAYVRPCRSRPNSPEWKELRATVFERDDYTCNYCGERGGRLECDHIVPVMRGGQDRLDNLTTACFACNRSKKDKLLQEWRP